MSLTIDGVWAAGVWATTVWADGVWQEGAVTPSKSGGHTSKRGIRKREFVELPNGDFVEVFTSEEAEALRSKFKPEPEAPQVEQKRILRMTPEVRKMIAKYKKGKGVSSQSLLGKRKGLTD